MTVLSSRVIWPFVGEKMIFKRNMCLKRESVETKGNKQMLFGGGGIACFFQCTLFCGGVGSGKERCCMTELLP